MVGWEAVLFDVSTVVSFYVLLPLVLAVFYLVAWRDSEGASHPLITPQLFWILLIGGYVGSLANIPFLYFHQSIMAINVGGGVVPVVLSLYLLWRSGTPPAAQAEIVTLGVWGAGAGLATYFVSLSLPWYFVVLAFLVPVPYLLFLVTTGFGAGWGLRGSLPLYATLSTVTIGTFLSTTVVLSAGVLSTFPEFLLPPMFAAILSVIFLRWSGRTSAILPTAYATATLGEMVGADFIHQPSFYVPGATPILGSIGGAGIEDLVFFAGPFAFTIALAVLLGFRWRSEPEPVGAAPRSSSLRDVVRTFEAARYPEVAPAVVRHLESRAHRVREALGFPSPPQGMSELAGLPLHPLVLGDYTNLTTVAQHPNVGRDEAHKSLVTGFFLLSALNLLFSQRLASALQRVVAFAIDLAVTILPEAVVLAALCSYWGLTNVDVAVNSIPFVAAYFGMGAYPFVALVLFEWNGGVTPGKWLLGLRVVGRGFEPPTLLESFGRNLTKILPIAFLGITVAVAVPLVLQFGWESVEWVAVVSSGILASAISGGISLAVLASDPGRRRVGDLMVGTQVVRKSGPKLMAMPGVPSPRSWKGLFQ
ncbi:MAG: RDD family protein [Candidatus Thermoplasmatota archaeon]|jgi:uncharacterized membrane protein/uncharacterized RDD family membrane protein YckC|nr:RDD family protein [Candidatus Thermoplasmatota archaeon]